MLRQLAENTARDLWLSLLMTMIIRFWLTAASQDRAEHPVDGAAPGRADRLRMRSFRACFALPLATNSTGKPGNRSWRARIEQEVGPIGVLVNNAGVQRRTPLEDFPTETWRELMRTNLEAVFYVGQAVALSLGQPTIMDWRPRSRGPNRCSGSPPPGNGR
jgi:NAD(P)-dependent dehydrogenase (short-subunit alcohol dehydrogenase family)